VDLADAHPREVTGTSPAMSPSRVVFPHPDGPTMLTNRPDPTVKLTSCTAVKSPVAVSNVRVTRSTVITAGYTMMSPPLGHSVWPA